jgi:DNA-binding MarR family transcriptional regulator
VIQRHRPVQPRRAGVGTSSRLRRFPVRDDYACGLHPGPPTQLSGQVEVVDRGRVLGLSYSDYVVLVALTDRPDGRMRLFELAGVLGWEKSRLSHHVARMATRGLVQKEKCDSDRRGAFVVITKQGGKEIEAAAPGHVRTVRRLFVDRLTPDELEVIATAAEKVLADMTVEQRSR